jgi:hypothetical protein
MDDKLLAIGSMAVLAHPVAAPTGLELRAVAKVEECGDAGRDLEYNVPPFAAVTTVRTPTGDEFFPAKRDAACAAVPSFNI